MITQLSTGVCVALLTVNASAAIELATNGDFETGDLSGWTFGIPQSDETFDITGDAFSGSFAGALVNSLANDGTPGAAFVSQVGIGAGTVMPGDTVTISFDAKGDFQVGGVFFVDLLSLDSGGGTTGVEGLDAPPTFPGGTWTNYSYTGTAGANVDGGLTLQIRTITGADPASVANLTIDNLSVTVVPEPASLGLLSVGALTMLRRRR